MRGALTLMGTLNVRRWSMMLALAGFTDRPQHLLATGLLRARQCELLARRPVDPAAAFTVGLFSILAGVLAFERGDFDACESHEIDLLEVAEAYRAALAWVQDNAPHLA